MQKELIDFKYNPNFSYVTPENMGPAVRLAIKQGREQIVLIKQVIVPTWNNVAEPLMSATDRVSRSFGLIEHITSVKSTSELRATEQELLPELSDFSTKINQDEKLYELFKQLKFGPEYKTYSAAQRRSIDLTIQAFELSGVNLPKDKKEKLAAINSELSVLTSKFEENILKSTDEFKLNVSDINELSGIPDNMVAIFADNAKKASIDGWRIGLSAPEVGAILKYANSQDLRYKIYRAYQTRASDQGNQAFDNTNNMQKILKLRAEKANILGYKNYAEVALVTKMAKSVSEVDAMLMDVMTSARPIAISEWKDLQKYARTEMGMDKIDPWDANYVSEKMRKSQYDFSETEVEQYFPTNRVVDALFQKLNQMYGITFAQKKVPVWHDDVKYYQVVKNGNVIGGIYVDLYARDGKRSGAWENGFQKRRVFDGKTQLPMAYLVANFTPPTSDNPATLKIGEIETLFHEMGHTMHEIMTTIDVLDVSGTSVEWDGVELPSQMMEEFVWNRDFLIAMSEHVKTHEKIPAALVDRVISAKHFQNGLFWVRQLEYGIFDMKIYESKTGDINIMDEWFRVREKYGVVPSPNWTRFPTAFSHIFAGGYAMGYYSYLWSRVLSSDVASVLIESPERSYDYLDEILSVGGSRPMAESFRAFMGRGPSKDAFLRLQGFKK